MLVPAIIVIVLALMLFKFGEKNCLLSIKTPSCGLNRRKGSKSSINIHNCYIATIFKLKIVLMNPVARDLSLDGQISFNLLEVCINWTKLNSEYLSIYVDTFLSTASEFHKLGQWTEFYDSWFSNMDRELEHELRSNQFTNTLTQFMNSMIALRSTYRRLGVPIEYYDILFLFHKETFDESLCNVLYEKFWILYTFRSGLYEWKDYCASLY